MLKHKLPCDILLILVFTLIAIPEMFSKNEYFSNSDNLLLVTIGNSDCAADGSSYDLQVFVSGGIEPYLVIPSQGITTDLGNGNFVISGIPNNTSIQVEVADANNEMLTVNTTAVSCCVPVQCDDNDCATEDSFDTNTCSCVNTPLPPINCDDNCIYTDDSYIQANCSCENILIAPDCDDNCDYTADWFDASICECLHQDTAPPTCDDADCTNGFEFWNPATCECEIQSSIIGCTDQTSPNYNPTANCSNPLACECTGCNDPTACNFDPTATCNNGSCIFEIACDTDPCTNGGVYVWNSITCECVLDEPTVLGCLDLTSPNFNPSANCADPSACICPDPGTCDDGICDNGLETWDAGICSCLDGIPTSPCIDDADCTNGFETWNSATCNCDVIPSIIGCTNNTANNFNPLANCDSNGCTFDCPDPGTCDDSDCTNGLETWDGTNCECIDGTPPNPNLCVDDGVCSNGIEIWNPNACTCEQINIPNPTLCIDDGICVNGEETWNPNTCTCEILNVPDPGVCFIGPNGDCTNAIEIWNDLTCFCDVVILGCTNPLSLNYDPEANCDNGTCTSCPSQDTTILELIVCDPDLVGTTAENYENILGCDSIVITNSFLDITFCEIGSLDFIIYYDVNENGVQDSNESSLPFTSILVEPTNEVYFSNSINGGFSFLSYGTYTLSYNQANTPLWELTTDASFDITLDANNPSANISFGLKPTQAISNIQIIMNNTIPRCNESVLFDLLAINTGTTIADGSILFSFDFETTVVIVDTPDNVVIPNNYTWNFSNLPPGGAVKRQIRVTFPGPPNIQIGQFLDFLTEVTYTDTNGTTTESLNSSIEILCGYDPNDKLVQPVYPENYALIDEDLIYTVRFQNTGNAEAYDVVIEDEIDPNLDLTTFKVLASSHEEVLSTKLSNNLVSFEFINIFLPDSTTNFDASQGYVTYSIRPFDDIEENTFIQNTANIFFDFNPAIVTNTTENNMVSTFDADEDGAMIWEDCNDNNPEINPGAVEIPDNGIDEDCDGLDLSTSIITFSNNNITVFPNPFGERLHIEQTNTLLLNYNLIDNTGRVIHDGILNQNQNTIDLNTMPSGIYFLKIIDPVSKNSGIQKIIKMN